MFLWEKGLLWFTHLFKQAQDLAGYCTEKLEQYLNDYNQQNSTNKMQIFIYILFHIFFKAFKIIAAITQF